MKKTIVTATTFALLAGCTSGNSHIEPPFTSVNTVATNSLEFAVGTANYQIADNSTMTPGLLTETGLNTVETFRQANGDSGTLVNSPTIVGPSGFVVPAASAEAGVDAGTDEITSTPQTVQPGDPTAPATTFSQAGGVFAYGFLPANSSNNSLTGTDDPGYAPYGQPFYTDAFSAGGTGISNLYKGGPPAYTNVQTGTYPGGFNGFTQGFNSFLSTIVSGTYTLNLVVPTSASQSSTISASATLAASHLLPTYDASATTVAEDGTGGATFGITIPAGVTETLVDVIDFGQDSSSTFTDCHVGYTAPYYYTVVDHTAGPGMASVTLPDNVGPIPATGGAALPTLCPGDDYIVEEIGADYPSYELGPGQGNALATAQSPGLTGSAGQDDITVSYQATTTSGIYGMSTARKPEHLRMVTKKPRLKLDTYHERHGATIKRRR